MLISHYPRRHVPAPLRFREYVLPLSARHPRQFSLLPYRAQADTVLPLSKPIRGKDGTLMDSIAVPKGTVVFVAIQSTNINPDVWGSDAHEWRPERWPEPLPESVAEAKIPGVYSNMYVFHDIDS